MNHGSVYTLGLDSTKWLIAHTTFLIAASFPENSEVVGGKMKIKIPAYINPNKINTKYY